jgi:hypothetical protein
VTRIAEQVDAGIAAEGRRRSAAHEAAHRVDASLPGPTRAPTHAAVARVARGIDAGIAAEGRRRSAAREPARALDADLAGGAPHPAPAAVHAVVHRIDAAIAAQKRSGSSARERTATLAAHLTRAAAHAAVARASAAVAGSVWGSTQRPSQYVGVAPPHVDSHRPSLHTSPARQLRPQAPQLRRSVRGSMHVPSQRICPIGHAVLPSSSGLASVGKVPASRAVFPATQAIDTNASATPPVHDECFMTRSAETESRGS